MKTAIVILMTLALVGSSFAQVDPVVQRAVTAVPVLHSMMRDPDSFVLESVFTTTTSVVLCETWTCRHKSKVPVDSVCFTFRSRNAYGGYGDSGFAVIRRSGQVSVLSSDDSKYGRSMMIDGGAKLSLTELSDPMHPCEAKDVTKDITAAVKLALNPPLVSALPTPAQTPAEQANKAQQYADCLKIAVGNPSIVCKQ